MSIPLPQINLAGVSVGQTGIVDLSNVGVSFGGVSNDPSGTLNAGTLHILNESGSGLLISFGQSGDGFYLPAGGWSNKKIKAGQQNLTYQVLYNLPNPPVSILLVTYYAPNEIIPPTPTLGNSPIGIGGTVNTSSVSTLSNESNTSKTLIIDIGEVGHTLLIQIYSDGSINWSLLQSDNSTHTLLQTQGTAGQKPLLIGQSGDHVEFLGTLDIDTNLFVVGTSMLDNGLFNTDGAGHPILNNNIALRSKDSGGTARDVLFVNTSNAPTIKGITGTDQVNIQKSDGTGIAAFNANGVILQSGQYNFLSGDTLARVGSTNGTGSGTFNHNLGATPDFAAITTHTNGSQTVGYDSETSTNFHVTTGAGLAWFAFLTKRT